MDAGLDHGLSPTAAAARLRYVSDVRQRTRRQLLTPSVALLVLGVLLLTRGVLVERWPRDTAVSIASFAGIMAIRQGGLLWQRRHELARGLARSSRLRLTCTTLGLLTALTATVVGTSPVIGGIAAATAAAAYLAGMPFLTVIVLLAGAAGDALVLAGVSTSIALVIFGAVMLTLGFATRSWEYHRL